jgi:transcriptional regulator
MYDLPYFKEEDKQVLLQFIYDYPFGFLTGSNASGKPVATQVPFMAEERDGKLFLHAHIMRQTDHHKAFLENPQVLAVFTGPHTYVSGTWYSGPPIASTWNFMSIHIRGKIRFLGEDALIALLKKLTLRFENNNTSSTTIFDNLPDEFRKRMMPAIVAFEIEVTEMENVFKLSQNRDEKSFRNIIVQLEKQGGDGTLIAAEMKKRMEKLFPPGKEWDSKKFLS